MRTCSICGKSFESKSQRAKYCSDDCIRASQRLAYTNNSKIIKSRSKDYYHKNRDRIRSQTVIIECAICGDEFDMKKQSAAIDSDHYCSTKCRSVGYKKKMGGEKHRWWRGGITPIHNKIRQSPEYNQWVKDVFKKDDYTCQCCGGRGVKISAHHKKNFAKLYPTMDDLLWEVENGITFCIDCHDSFHMQYGKIDNSPEQVKEFLGYVI